MTSSDGHRQLKVFISHQWTDKQVADRVAQDLEQFAEVWMDYRNLRPGDSIQGTIDEALASADLVLVLWTRNSAKSDGVRAEIESSQRQKLRVVPCVFEYDEGGKPSPSLPDTLKGVLWVDFHHYGSGLVQLADLIVALKVQLLPEEARPGAEHPSRRVANYLRGYLSYLANYRKLRGVPDERAVWVDKIVGEIERFLDGGGNPELVRGMVEAARRSEVDDREGIGTLIERLDAALAARGGGGPGEEEAAAPGGEPRDGRARSRAKPASNVDELTRRVAAVVPAAQLAAAVAGIDLYLQSAPPALQALHSYALQAQSPAGVQVVTYLGNYLGEANDLIPDARGRFGHLDDAWLILNTAFRLIESGLVPIQAVPIDWPNVISIDHMVRAILPAEVLEELTAAVFEMLQIIQTELAAYQPWFETQGSGYAPHISQPGSGGGTFEDQVNQMLLGTGLSVDG